MCKNEQKPEVEPSHAMKKESSGDGATLIKAKSFGAGAV